MARFEVFEGVDGQFYFRLKAGNGEIIVQSEGYTTRDHAKRGIGTLVALAGRVLPTEDV